MEVHDPQTWDASLILGILYTAIYGSMIACVVFVNIPEGNAKTIDLLAGAMTIIQTTIVQYFFGSNKIADDNQRLIAQKMTVSTPTPTLSAVPTPAPIPVEIVAKEPVPVTDVSKKD